jgi:hypothetical protein
MGRDGVKVGEKVVGAIAGSWQEMKEERAASKAVGGWFLG